MRKEKLKEIFKNAGYIIDEEKDVVILKIEKNKDGIGIMATSLDIIIKNWDDIIKNREKNGWDEILKKLGI